MSSYILTETENILQALEIEFIIHPMYFFSHHTELNYYVSLDNALMKFFKCLFLLINRKTFMKLEEVVKSYFLAHKES